MAYSPELLEAILAAAQRYGVPADLLVATTLIESSGRLEAVGDGGASHGPFQENDNGRGSGLSIAERRDPRASADRAAREFASFQARGYRGGALAAAAQRPADPGGYAAKVDDALPIARRLIAQGGGTVELEGGIADAARGGVEATLGGAASLAGDVLDGPIGAVLGFIQDYVVIAIAFVALGAIAVWLVGQGASRAFGTPSPGAVINRVTPGG